MIARLLISQSYSVLTSFIEQDLKKYNLKRNHPDLLYLKKGTKLGINEAKKIKEHFSLKPYAAEGRIVVLEDASEMTLEAQNALLKTIEELPPEAIFIFGTTSDANLLPTIISRCQIVKLNFATKQGEKSGLFKYEQDLQQLLGSDIPSRFQYIEKLQEKEEFLHYMVHYFREQLHHSESRQTLKGFLEKLLRSEEWAKQNVNIRAILEYLMLVMPVGK